MCLVCLILHKLFVNKFRTDPCFGPQAVYVKEGSLFYKSSKEKALQHLKGEEVLGS